MEYNINMPWLSLDPWQKEYIYDTEPNKDCFLLTGRQVGKTTGMSLKSVELCVKHFKKGEFVLICSITEKQAYHMLTKALVYAEAKYPNLIMGGKDKPTMHKLYFKNGTGILCFAAGERGEGLRGFTIKKLMIDEGSRMSDEFFIAVSPMLSVVKGSMDIASTPCGKDGFFYKCSLDEKFKKFYVSAEDCPRHTKEFLNNEKERLSRLAYAQEYLAIFTDELKRLFDDDLIKDICTLRKLDEIKIGTTYLGVDVAGFGKDENAFCVLQRLKDKKIRQLDQVIEKRKYTTETTETILRLNLINKFRRIGVDDGGLGFGVFSELMNIDDTKRKTEALNNASRVFNQDEKTKKLLKEEMYFNLLSLMEQKKIKLLNMDELKASLASIQYDDGKIFGSYSHIAESIIRAAWLAEKDKHLNIFAHLF
jgi:hypothetical protein